MAKKAPKNLPPKRPTDRYGWTPRCPECGHRRFVVVPHVVPELVREYHDGGEVTTVIEDYVMDDGDTVGCQNCGWSGTWAQADHRRNSRPDPIA